ncbi:hypothetical protein FPRO05_03331 [Fusarium proliferatum]|uniref:Helicase ATP-binding domain-containing protein n=1 Tax=Gibberella intermedia TaxID=948311 RepID=A0A365MTK0_GIBIN|nr:hypothetical protein FPRO05_03331 [Fusarium proliferatum]
MKFRFVNEGDPATLHQRRLQAQRTQRCRQRQKARQHVETTNHQADGSQTVDSATENVQTRPGNRSLTDTGEFEPNTISSGEPSIISSQEDYDLSTIDTGLDFYDGELVDAPSTEERQDRTEPMVEVSKKPTLRHINGARASVTSTLLQSQAQLDRIVIDECHTILEGNLAFRPKLREIGRLAQRGIQMVYIIATLPIAEEAEFFSLIYSTPKSATFFRFPTTRPNIRYGVSSFDIQGVDDIAAVAVAAVRESIGQILARYASTAKVIVYCQTKEATQALAEALGCEAYYSDLSRISL